MKKVYKQREKVTLVPIFTITYKAICIISLLLVLLVISIVGLIYVLGLTGNNPKKIIPVLGALIFFSIQGNRKI